MKNEIESSINANKEVLSSLPQNNIKNKNKYIEEVNKLISNYTKCKDSVFNEINKRVNKLNGIKTNNKIAILKQKIEEIESKLHLFYEYTDSYQKMSLDKILYDISHFYKANLEKINYDILESINVFKKVGIKLIPNDFNYSIFAKEYMVDFFEAISLKEPKFEDMEKTFENVYWKCPDVITHIDLNIRYLYYKNKKIFDDYVNKEANKILNEMGKSKNGIREEYEKLIIEYDELINNDVYTIINNFTSSKFDIKNYTNDKIEKNYSTLINSKYLSMEDKNKYIDDIIKLSYSLMEYKNIIYFDFIIKKVLDIYKEKDKYKDVFKNKLIEIAKLEKILFKDNMKCNKIIEKDSKEKKGLFSKNNSLKIEKNILNTNNRIVELKKLYDELDGLKFNDMVNIYLNDDSTIYGLLNLALADYDFLVDSIREKNEGISMNEVNIIIGSLKKFLLSPYNTIINNLNIINDKSLSIIISDRYKLLNLNIEVDDISEGNIDTLLDITNNVINNYYIENNKVSKSEIDFLCNANKIITK